VSHLAQLPLDSHPTGLPSRAGRPVGTDHDHDRKPFIATMKTTEKTMNNQHWLMVDHVVKPN